MAQLDAERARRAKEREESSRQGEGARILRPRLKIIPPSRPSDSTGEADDDDDDEDNGADDEYKGSSIGRSGSDDGGMEVDGDDGSRGVKRSRDDDEDEEEVEEVVAEDEGEDEEVYYVLMDPLPEAAVPQFTGKWSEPARPGKWHLHSFGNPY